jgi:hypothetical protein
MTLNSAITLFDDSLNLMVWTEELPNTPFNSRYLCLSKTTTISPDTDMVATVTSYSSSASAKI